MDNCVTCHHAKHDPTWGEDKCQIHRERTHILMRDFYECGDYEEDPEKRRE